MGAFIENHPTVVVGILVAIAGIFYWAGSIRTDVNTLKEFMEEIRSDVKKIFERLPAKATASESPLTLTNLGEKISQEIQGSTWAKQIAPRVVALVKGKDPYDIQEFCLEHVKGESILTEEMDAKVKASAYNNGIEKWQVLRVLALELRDELLKELGIEQES